MRFATLAVALAALGACVPADGQEDGAPSCGAEALQPLVGTPVAEHDFAEGARIIPPGTAVTMDYRSDRLNVETDDAGVITRIYCG
ncbi:I78 family peptidase inhibitor [Roseovarius indicus]|uniref:I78 family peptidase inhibitor n=1 Tax=Roseovarius indicus TaxID=540747 RepID=UPI0032ED5688